MTSGDRLDMAMDLGYHKTSHRCTSCRKCCVFPVALACEMIVFLKGVLPRMQFCLFSQRLFNACSIAFSNAFSILCVNSHGFTTLHFFHDYAMKWGFVLHKMLASHRQPTVRDIDGQIIQTLDNFLPREPPKYQSCFLLPRG